MRSKGKIITLTIGILIINFFGCKNGSAQERSEEEKAKNDLKIFYTNYIKMNSGSEFNRTDSLLDMYCTKKLREYIDSLYAKDQTRFSYDVLLKTQMYDDRMLEGLTVRKDSGKNNIYYVTYTYGKGQATIKVLVVKEKENYKIDHIFVQGVDEDNK